MKNNQQPTTDIQHPMLGVAARQWLFNVPKFVLLRTVRAYKILVSPVLTFLCGPLGGCRFTPTCSAYAAEAVRAHGAVAGSFLAAKRICRCTPWGGCGHDPVPKQKFTHHASSITD
jgi:putative membrane protein insertion efficiency factor